MSSATICNDAAVFADQVMRRHLGVGVAQPVQRGLSAMHAGIMQHHEVRLCAVAARPEIGRRVPVRASPDQRTDSLAERARIPATGKAVAIGIEAQTVTLGTALREEVDLRLIGRGVGRAVAAELGLLVEAATL